MKQTTRIAILLAALTGLLAGCKSIKPYQRQYLNDADMQTGSRPVDKFEHNVHDYREGSTGGALGKGGGGCGCN